MADFTTGAWIVGGRVQHDINRDHFGDLSTLNVVLDSKLGSQEMYTPLHYVLDWMVQRIIDLESSNHFGGGFSANAYILGLGDTVDVGGGEIHGVFGDFAVLKLSHPWQSYLIDALLTLAFTADANIRAQEELTADAVIV